MALISSQTYQSVIILAFLTGVGLFGAITFVPLYLQAVLDVSPTATGQMFAPTVVAKTAMSVIAGIFMHRIGYRVVTLATMAAGAIGFGDEDCHKITLALDEAITNVIRHAYGGKLEGPIEIHFHKLNGADTAKPGLEITLIDRGAKARPDALKGLPPGELRSGGLGLHFMRQSMDAVVHTRVGSTNRLRMVKFIH